MPPNQILWDPGIGFGKTAAHNLSLCHGLDSLVATGYPVILGTSRKRFMGSICTLDGERPLPERIDRCNVRHDRTGRGGRGPPVSGA
ncbi:MAG: dihydropteroate synthase [Phycisphaeraceae bacterium]|nr:dihydropteroate synthase [Phycisphaeraceae bacterium]